MRGGAGSHKKPERGGGGGGRERERSFLTINKTATSDSSSVSATLRPVHSSNVCREFIKCVSRVYFEGHRAKSLSHSGVTGGECVIE